MIHYVNSDKKEDWNSAMLSMKAYLRSVNSGLNYNALNIAWKTYAKVYNKVIDLVKFVDQHYIAYVPSTSGYYDEVDVTDLIDTSSTGTYVNTPLVNIEHVPKYNLPVIAFTSTANILDGQFREISREYVGRVNREGYTKASTQISERGSRQGAVLSYIGKINNQYNQETREAAAEYANVVADATTQEAISSLLDATNAEVEAYNDALDAILQSQQNSSGSSDQNTSLGTEGDGKAFKEQLAEERERERQEAEAAAAAAEAAERARQEAAERAQALADAESNYNSAKDALDNAQSALEKATAQKDRTQGAVDDISTGDNWNYSFGGDRYIYEDYERETYSQVETTDGREVHTFVNKTTGSTQVFVDGELLGTYDSSAEAAAAANEALGSDVFGSDGTVKDSALSEATGANNAAGRVKDEAQKEYDDAAAAVGQAESDLKEAQDAASGDSSETP